MDSLAFTLPLLIVLLPLSLVCAVTGVLLSARRQAMLPDALSHAILPGVIVAAFLQGGGVNALTIALGSVVASVMALGIIRALVQWTNANPAVALGVTYPTMLSLGLVLMAVTGLDQTGFDAHTVLFGSLDFLFWPEAMGILSRQPNDWISAVVTSPVGFQFAILAAAVAVVGIPLMYAGLNEQLFDEQQFQRRGRAGVLMVEALVLILVTLTAVAAFFVVGAVMAVALFAAPAVMARGFATNLGVWVGGAMLAAGLCTLVSFSGLILLPELLLPAFGLDPWLGLQGLSFTGTYAVLTCGLAIALVLWPTSKT